jgi:Asp-tRNA(Asn)/Glu-tRNA(Gln) amidotransferase A subunit family amidase
MRCFAIILAATLAAVLHPGGDAWADFAPHIILEDATITQVHQAMVDGRLTCRALVDSYLERIAAYDKAGPRINAIVALNPKALTEAEALDQRFARSGLTGPLHCVPLIVKDNFETKGLQTTAGSLAFAGYMPGEDATVVARAKAAGAIVLAKSNMAEWALSAVETVSSILPGYTRNPYDTDRSTAGSSGGTAAAVAANFALAGFGSDTGGSIRGPAAHQALVGMRATQGITSRAGVFPLDLRQDVTGPLARTVEDELAIFQAIAGPDPRDPATAVAGEIVLPEIKLNRDALKGARIGVLHEAYDRNTADPEILAIFNRALDDLRRAGATLIDPAQVEDFGAIHHPPVDPPCMGFKYDLNSFLAARAGKVPLTTLDAIIASGKFHPSVQRRLEEADRATSNGPDSAPCQADEAYRARLRAAVIKTMDDLKLDAFVYPTWSNPPRLIGDLNTPAGDNNQLFAPVTGFPAITVPMGYTHGDLPAGLSIYGRAWSEALLFRYAYAYEQATHHRRPPTSAPPLK